MLGEGCLGPVPVPLARAARMEVIPTHAFKERPRPRYCTLNMVVSDRGLVELAYAVDGYGLAPSPPGPLEIIARKLTFSGAGTPITSPKGALPAPPPAVSVGAAAAAAAAAGSCTKSKDTAAAEIQSNAAAYLKKKRESKAQTDAPSPVEVPKTGAKTKDQAAAEIQGNAAAYLKKKRELTAQTDAPEPERSTTDTDASYAAKRAAWLQMVGSNRLINAGIDHAYASAAEAALASAASRAADVTSTGAKSKDTAAAEIQGKAAAYLKMKRASPAQATDAPRAAHVPRAGAKKSEDVAAAEIQGNAAAYLKKKREQQKKTGAPSAMTSIPEERERERWASASEHAAASERAARRTEVLKAEEERQQRIASLAEENGRPKPRYCSLTMQVGNNGKVGLGVVVNGHALAPPPPNPLVKALTQCLGSQLTSQLSDAGARLHDVAQATLQSLLTSKAESAPASRAEMQTPEELSKRNAAAAAIQSRASAYLDRRTFLALPTEVQDVDERASVSDAKTQSWVEMRRKRRSKGRPSPSPARASTSSAAKPSDETSRGSGRAWVTLNISVSDNGRATLDMILPSTPRASLLSPVGSGQPSSERHAAFGGGEVVLRVTEQLASALMGLANSWIDSIDDTRKERERIRVEAEMAMNAFVGRKLESTEEQLLHAAVLAKAAAKAAEGEVGFFRHTESMQKLDELRDQARAASVEYKKARNRALQQLENTPSPSKASPASPNTPNSPPSWRRWPGRRFEPEAFTA